MLPSPPPDNSPHSLGSHLKYITRVPDTFLMRFSKDNPFVEKAIAQFKRAAEVSHYQNRPAVYDLAYILAQTERYDESKQMCKTIISERSGPKGTTINFPVYLVNAYNLYGVCCEKQAEMIESDSGIDNTQKHRTDLLIESEQKFDISRETGISTSKHTRTEFVCNRFVECL
ncbi:unnamed protein product [Candidula unifasciata]|uniref:Uncharacterized protein n=1 Tax=Candidula unifasciata TaxID=100452 RepID=A0A8S4A4X9_9EUPU|nr:unnamed protein product [Candidula unifasciata]